MRGKNEAAPAVKHTKGSVFTTLAFQALESKSTLDSSRHTVVETQCSSQALEEVNPMLLDTNVENILVSLVYDDLGRGKENKVPKPLDQKQLPYVFKLKSNIMRNLKVRKKPLGAHISKDAIKILREQLEKRRSWR